MFWLVQFQRLLLEKPVALRKLEAQIEPEINQLLTRARVSDGVPEAFATHRITTDQESFDDFPFSSLKSRVKL